MIFVYHFWGFLILDGINGGECMSGLISGAINFDKDEEAEGRVL